MGEITLVPAEFTLVKFDAAELRDLVATTMATVGFPTDVDVTVEVDEVLPHPLTASQVSVGESTANLWFTGGCFESPQRQAGLSRANTQVELGAALLRAMDRMSGGFEAAPPDDDLDDRQRNLWDAYAEARCARLGLPVREPRRHYTFRLYCGFNDVSDVEYDRIWNGATLDWDEVVAFAERLADADTRPERKQSLRRESLRQATAG